MSVVCRRPRVGELILNNRNGVYMRLCLSVSAKTVTILILDGDENSTVEVPASRHVIEANLEKEEWV